MNWKTVSFLFAPKKKNTDNSVVFIEEFGQPPSSLEIGNDAKEEGEKVPCQDFVSEVFEGGLYKFIVLTCAHSSPRWLLVLRQFTKAFLT